MKTLFVLGLLTIGVAAFGQTRMSDGSGVATLSSPFPLPATMFQKTFYFLTTGDCATAGTTPTQCYSNGSTWTQTGGGGSSGGFVYIGLLSGIPAVCTVGQLAFITDATPGQNQYNCTSTNVFTQNLNGSLSVYVQGTGLIGTRSNLNFIAGSGIQYVGVDTGTAINLNGTVDTAVIQSKANLQSGTAPNICTSASGSGTAYLATCATTLTALATKQIFWWNIDHISASTAPTLAVDGLTSQTVTDSLGNALANSTTLAAGTQVPVWNDGTHFRIMTLPQGGGSTIYPGAGVANSTGSAWTTSYQVGTAGNDLVQLTAAAKLPAVDGSLLTNLPSAPYSAFQGNTGTVAMTGSDVTIWTFSGVAPLAAGTCYTFHGTIEASASATYKIIVDGSTTISTPLLNGGAGFGGYYYIWSSKYCNNPGSQTVQTLTYPEPQFFTSLANYTLNGGVGPSTSWGESPQTTPTGINWATSHTITVTVNALTGTAIGAMFSIN